MLSLFVYADSTKRNHLPQELWPCPSSSVLETPELSILLTSDSIDLGRQSLWIAVWRFQKCSVAITILFRVPKHCASWYRVSCYWLWYFSLSWCQSLVRIWESDAGCCNCLIGEIIVAYLSCDSIASLLFSSPITLYRCWCFSSVCTIVVHKRCHLNVVTKCPGMKDFTNDELVGRLTLSIHWFRLFFFRLPFNGIEYFELSEINPYIFIYGTKQVLHLKCNLLSTVRSITIEEYVLYYIVDLILAYIM